MVLLPDAKIGQPAKEYFKIENDVVFEIGLTPNRIDAASHIGVARDLAAWLSQNTEIKYKKPSVDLFKVDNKSNTIPIEIEKPALCNRFTGVTVSGIEVKESPEWLKNRLKAIGQKPINNVVDITNYVLHETGQPLHAYDTDMIAGKKVIAKTLPKGTKFITLDEMERELSSEDLMICNTTEGMCIAGVFGGSKSGVTGKTKNIFIECAYFNPVSVRKTSKRHTLQTDASFRFERGVDINNLIYALKRTALLVQELAGGTISSELIDVYPNKIDNQKVNILYSHIDRLIGKKIEHDKIRKILKSLEINITEDNDINLVVEVPSYRVDITREADVIEEILRIYGYNNVEPYSSVKSTISYAPKPDRNKLKNMVADMLSAKGFNETMNNSLTKAEYYEKFKAFDKSKTVKILNPLSADLNGMRQTLLIGGLECIIYNENRKNNNLKFYEFGNCYQFDPEVQNGNALSKYSEKEQLALFIYGNKKPLSWNSSEIKSDFFHLKTFVELVFEKLGYDLNTLKQNEMFDDIFAYGLSYSHGKDTIVSFGLVHKSLRKEFDIENEVYYAVFEWDLLMKYLPVRKQFSPLAKFPEVKRDLALLVDKNISFAKIKDLACKSERQLLKSVSIFDVYEGEKLGEGKKSYAVSYILQDENKTLTDKQIDKIMGKFIQLYETELGAKIR
jgi:phenylalanyl-tRNA synthetase beta chain